MGSNIRGNRIHVYVGDDSKITVNSAFRFWQDSGKSVSKEVCAAVKDRYHMQKGDTVGIRFPRINDDTTFNFEELIRAGKLPPEEALRIAQILSGRIGEIIRSANKIIEENHALR